MDNKYVLVVEDDPDIRENMISLIEGEGYRALAAQNGKEALDHLLNKSQPLPRLIALDLFMPVMDGRLFLNELEKHHERDFTDVTIVLITAADASARAGLEGKTVAVLRKPIDIEAFLALVKTYLERPEAH